MKIIVITGLSASGKSTISKLVSTKLQLPRVDLHSIISEMAHEQGYPRGRDWIEGVGAPEALEKTRVEMASRVESNRNDRGVIVDEIVDPQTLEYFRNRFKEDDIDIIFVRTNRHDKERFMRKRLGKGEFSDAKKETRFIDRNKEGVGIREVILQANFRIENFGDIGSVVEEATSLINSEILMDGPSVSKETAR